MSITEYLTKVLKRDTNIKRRSEPGIAIAREAVRGRSWSVLGQKNISLSDVEPDHRQLVNLYGRLSPEKCRSRHMLGLAKNRIFAFLTSLKHTMCHFEGSKCVEVEVRAQK